MEVRGGKERYIEDHRKRETKRKHGSSALPQLGMKKVSYECARLRKSRVDLYLELQLKVRDFQLVRGLKSEL